MGFPGSSAGKESACNAVDPGSIPLGKISQFYFFIPLSFPSGICEQLFGGSIYYLKFIIYIFLVISSPQDSDFRSLTFQMLEDHGVTGIHSPAVPTCMEGL